MKSYIYRPHIFVTVVSILASLGFVTWALAAPVLTPSRSEVIFGETTVGGEAQQEITISFVEEGSTSPSPSPSPSPTPSLSVTPPPSSTGGGSGSGSRRTSGSSRVSPPSSVTTAPPFTSVLARGSQGSEVLRLQTFLVSKGYLPSDAMTGLYGPQTEAAVKQYQCARQIMCSGTAFDGYGNLGPRTRTAINAENTVNVASGQSLRSSPTGSVSAAPFTTILSRGSRTPDVVRLQTFLVSKGYLAADGVTGLYGPLTEAAVKQYQCARQIMCSGTAFDGYGNLGPRTRAAINAENTTTSSPGSTSSATGSREQLAAQIQQLLSLVSILQAQINAQQGR